jgi:hypothetical protein
MGKFLVPALFVVLVGLCAGTYAYFVLEIDGSTVTTKQHLTQPQIRRE